MGSVGKKLGKLVGQAAPLVGAFNPAAGAIMGAVGGLGGGGGEQQAAEAIAGQQAQAGGQDLAFFNQYFGPLFQQAMESANTPVAFQNPLEGQGGRLAFNRAMAGVDDDTARYIAAANNDLRARGVNSPGSEAGNAIDARIRQAVRSAGVRGDIFQGAQAAANENARWQAQNRSGQLDSLLGRLSAMRSNGLGTLGGVQGFYANQAGLKSGAQQKQWEALAKSGTMDKLFAGLFRKKKATLPGTPPYVPTHLSIPSVGQSAGLVAGPGQGGYNLGQTIGTSNAQSPTPRLQYGLRL